MSVILTLDGAKDTGDLLPPMRLRVLEKDILGRASG